MQLDKISLKALRKLYKAPMAEEEYRAVLGWAEKDQFNEVDSFLRKNKLVKRVIISGVEDGAGGYVDGTIVSRYEIMLDGRKAVEQYRLAGMAAVCNCLRDFLQTIFPFLPL